MNEDSCICTKKQIIFNQWRKQGQSNWNKVKVYYIGIQNYVQLPETWCTQDAPWCLFGIRKKVSEINVWGCESV